MTKVGGIIMGLGAKVGDDVRSAVTKLGQKYGDNVWTSAGKTGVDNAIRHWNDHAADFPELSSLDEYVDYAHNFLKSPSKETLTKIRHNGDIMRYEPSSNTFGVMNADGIPKTIFKPKNGYEYWLRQK
jgi:pyocin large subunit-like protein